MAPARNASAGPTAVAQITMHRHRLPYRFAVRLPDKEANPARQAARDGAAVMVAREPVARDIGAGDRLASEFVIHVQPLQK